MNNINNKQKATGVVATYCDTEYQDFADYNSSLKNLWESLKNSATESIESSWKRQWELVSKLNKPLDQPVWIREYLGRKQFYSQNGLPVELNLIIEEMVAADYTHPLQQLAYKELVERDKKRKEYLKEIANCQEHINDLEKEEKEYIANLQEALKTKMPGIQEWQEKVRKEKEIKDILAKEIKEWQERQVPKPLLLPSLPQKQTRVKLLANKIKTQFQQLVKPPVFKEKPTNNPFSIYRTLLITRLFF